MEVGKNKYECPECGDVYSKMGMVNHYYRKHTEEGKGLCRRLKEEDDVLEKMNRMRRKTGHLNKYEKA